VLVLRNFRDAGGKTGCHVAGFAVHASSTSRAAHPCPRALEALPRSHHAKAVGTRKYVATRARQGWAPCARERLACVVDTRFAISASHRPLSPAACDADARREFKLMTRTRSAIARPPTACSARRTGGDSQSTRVTPEMSRKISTTRRNLVSSIRSKRRSPSHVPATTAGKHQK